MEVINEAKQGTCPKCGKDALLDKGNGKTALCEKCYYEEGNHLPLEAERDSLKNHPLLTGYGTTKDEEENEK